MMKFFKSTSGDAALVVNDSLVMVGDPAIDDVANVETVSENLACALDQALVRVRMSTPEADDVGENHRRARGRQAPKASR